jgi:hypothetical protein
MLVEAEEKPIEAGIGVSQVPGDIAKGPLSAQALDHRDARGPAASRGESPRSTEQG